MFSRRAPRCVPRCPAPPPAPCRAGGRRPLSAIARPQVVFSGIQPTGIPHLGNYLGALQRWVKLQNEAPPSSTLIYSIVDLHAITKPQERAQLRQWRKEMLASLLAVGLDPKRSIIFNQSAVSAHSELMWILSCQASMGYLSRMTQWKSKLSLPSNASPLDISSTKNKELKLGLFSYPVLQAADILVHRATHVPVGEDQSQHLEFARECAGSFNHLAQKAVLVPPATLISPAKRVMSLTRPEEKMSKSDENPKSRILITDSREEIQNKIRTAKTDSIEGVSYDPESRPGVSNLIEIMFHLTNGEDGTAASCEELAHDCKDLSMRALKERVVDVVDSHLEGIRAKYEELMNAERESSLLEEIAEQGAREANANAAKTMRDVRDAVGL